MDEELKNLSTRELQIESSKALTVWKPSVVELGSLNKVSYHDSRMFYCEVIKHYINEYGDYPSKTGPAKDVKLLVED